MPQLDRQKVSETENETEIEGSVVRYPCAGTAVLAQAATRNLVTSFQAASARSLELTSAWTQTRCTSASYPGRRSAASAR